MSGFPDYWRKAKIPANLTNLKQAQLDEIRKVAMSAYRAGQRSAKEEAPVVLDFSRLKERL